MYRVVIVEDDPMVSLLNRTFVERDARFQVVQSFQDGRAALAWLEQNPADLAVLDVYMPLFTGLELLHALRGQGVGIDAIMVTAANDAPTVDTLLKLGVVDYLVKPPGCGGRGRGGAERAGPALFPRPPGGAPAAQGPPGEHPGACARLPAGGTAPGPAQRSPLPPDRPFSGDGAAVCQLPGRAGGGGQRRQL